MLISKWKLTERREADRLVLEVPAQIKGGRLVELAFWQALWPIGALVLPVYLADWIDSPLILLPLMALVAFVWMIPWFFHWLMAVYWLRGMERITIRRGTVEIERGFGRWVRRRSYEGIKDSSWRVSPWQHHAPDWERHIGWFGLYGPNKPGGALTFTHGRRAVRCGRNFRTRQARIVLHDVQLFLGQPVTGKAPKKKPKWLTIEGGEISGW